MDVVITRAMDVFWTRGYQGTSLPDLLTATGLSRASLYAAFGDKRGLFLNALDRYISDSLNQFDGQLAAVEGPIAGLHRFAEGYVMRTWGDAGARGCLLVASTMELAASDPEVSRRVRAFFDSLEAKLLKVLKAAQKEKMLAKSIAPIDAARILMATVEGLRVVSKTGFDCHAWRRSIHSLIDMFESEAVHR